MTVAIRRLVAAILIGAVLLLFPFNAAQASPGHMTMTLDYAPVRQVLEVLFLNAHKKYTLAADVDGFVSVRLNNISFAAALHTVLIASDPKLICHLRHGTYHVQTVK